MECSCTGHRLGRPRFACPTGGSRWPRRGSASAPPTWSSRSCAVRLACSRRSRSCPSCGGCCRPRSCRSSGGRCSRRCSAARSASASSAVLRASARQPRSSPAVSSRWRRPRSRCAAPTSPPTTAPSTSRSVPTSTARRARRSTSAAARTSSVRCSPPRPSRAPSLLALRSAYAAPPASARPSARSRRRRRSSAGWCGIRNAAWPGCSLAPGTSSSIASRPPSRARRSSRSPRRRSGRASSSNMAITEGTKRLPPEIFDLPVEKMRAGYYTDAYFNHARETLLTDEQASWWGGKGVGTVPHSLISAYGGDTVLAAERFAEWAPPDLNVVVLVDFENDSVRTSLEVARALGPRLWGVRLDTAETLVDRSLSDALGQLLLAHSGRLEEIGDRPRDAVALRLTGDHDGVELEQGVDEHRVLLTDPFAVRPGRHLGPENRVVLRQRVLALDLEGGLGEAGDRVEEERLLNGGHPGMAPAAG